MIKIENILRRLNFNEEKKVAPPYTLYCDQDGVLTNVNGRFEHFSGMPPKEYISKYGEPAFWYLIDVKVGIAFWSEMGWMPQGKSFWSFVAPYNPIILTSPSRNNTSRLGKNIWITNNLNPHPKVIFAFEKEQYATSNSILIDDKKSNIEKWEKAGGIAIRYKEENQKEVIDRLKELGY
jgi:hypothetical protein